ncbi:MAG: hypothetical protein Q8907_15370, partial [Bacteroidota bacterium]|nr:hypothetical protein [Bacteroidota bacterium]
TGLIEIKAMPEKFQNKFRISLLRLQNWDNGSNGLYFVTICTDKRECYLGKITSPIIPTKRTNRFAKMETGNIGRNYKSI